MTTGTPALAFLTRSVPINRAQGRVVENLSHPEDDEPPPARPERPKEVVLMPRKPKDAPPAGSPLEHPLIEARQGGGRPATADPVTAPPRKTMEQRITAHLKALRGASATAASIASALQVPVEKVIQPLQRGKDSRIFESRVRDDRLHWTLKEKWGADLEKADAAADLWSGRRRLTQDAPCVVVLVERGEVTKLDVHPKLMPILREIIALSQRP